MPLKDLPPDARPREKLLARGAGALSDAELLALLLRTGIKGKGALRGRHRRYMGEIGGTCRNGPVQHAGHIAQPGRSAQVDDFK